MKNIQQRQRRAAGRNLIAVVDRASKLAALMVLSTILAWLISSNDQRIGYLRAFGLGTLIDRFAGQELVVSAPGFEYSLIRFPARHEPSRPSLELARRLEDPLSRPRHETDIGQPCSRRPVVNPSRKTQREIYRWTDASGKVVFSDRTPSTAPAQVIGQTSQGGVGMFSAEYRYLGGEPDPAFRLTVAANVNGVFQFLVTSLGLQEVEPLHVRLTVVYGEERFLAYRETRARNLATVSGFYSFLNNEAVVRWLGAETSMAVARHEIMHLALGNWLGEVPLWLNEGLAEFVERLSFKQSYALSAAPGRKMAEVVRLREAGRLPPLGEFLAMERPDWYRIGNDIAYPYAWSLAHFLIETSARRSLVSDYLGILAQNRCRTLDPVQSLDRLYPGGVTQLEEDWSTWLHRGHWPTLTF